MPIYEYECSQCHQVSDTLQKVSDPPPEACPRCGATNTLSRLVSRTSFVLKGGGWYSDLYSSTPGKKADGDAKPAAGTSAPASTGTSGTSTPSTGGSGTSGSGTSGSGTASSSGSASTGSSAPKVAAAGEKR